jgi:hypothetical protein
MSSYVGGDLVVRRCRNCGFYGSLSVSTRFCSCGREFKS